MQAMEESFKYINNYQDFTDFPNKDDKFLIEIEQYFHKKVYNSPFGDLVPAILCNALKIRINILDESNTGSINEIVVNPSNLKDDEAPKCSIFVTLRNEHYTGLAPMQPRETRSEQNVHVYRNEYIETNVACSNRYSPLMNESNTAIFDELRTQLPSNDNPICSTGQNI